jgi:hypothetical protein
MVSPSKPLAIVQAEVEQRQHGLVNALEIKVGFPCLSLAWLDILPLSAIKRDAELLASNQLRVSRPPTASRSRRLCRRSPPGLPSAG